MGKKKTQFHTCLNSQVDSCSIVLGYMEQPLVVLQDWRKRTVFFYLRIIMKNILKWNFTAKLTENVKNIAS